MRFRNKHQIDFSDNPLKKNPELLGKKNALEARWYDQEAEAYFAELNSGGEMLPMDETYEKEIGPFFDDPADNRLHDRNAFFFRTFPRVEGQAMLDLGAGNGILSRFFLRRGMHVVSVDISPRVCEFLKKSDRRSVVVRSCAERLPFADQSFDVVMSLVSLHHFNLELSLSEIWRVLKRGGEAVFMEPLLNSRTLYRLRQMVPVEDNESPGGGGLCKDELENILNSVGFEYAISEFEVFTRLERLPLLGRFQDTLRKLDHRLLAFFPILGKLARLAVIQLRKS